MIRILFCVLLLIKSVTNAHASFGSSCVPVAITGDAVYLTNYTAYGYLVQFIDSNIYVPNGSCNDNLPHIVVCIQNGNTAAGSPPCDLVTFLPDGRGQALQNISTNPLLSQNVILHNIELRAQYIGQNICLTMPTSYGYTPLVCKALSPAVIPPAPQDGITCQSVVQRCSSSTASQSTFNFSGRAMECLSETLQGLFYPQPPCTSDPRLNITWLNSFAVFQQALATTVRALLMMYVIGFGISIALHTASLNLETIISFLMKAILVCYFAVGLGPAYFSNGQKTVHTGMLEWGLPIFTQLTNDLATIVFAAGGAHGLCDFDTTKYPQGKGYYALWDKIDCKLGAYLMSKKIYNIGIARGNFTEVTGLPAENDTTLPMPSALTGYNSINDAASASEVTGQMGLFFVLFHFLLGGYIIIVFCLLSFLIIFLTLILGFISLYNVAFLTLNVLIYISPIFIPMVLFARTKSYFDAWLRVTLSCALQPMVMAGFIAIVMTLYDDVIFQDCVFRLHEYTDGRRYLSTFELRLPADLAAQNLCMGSPGYLLINYMLGAGWKEVGLLIVSVTIIKDTLSIMAGSVMLLIFSGIFYYFLDSIYTFAAEVTSGTSMASVLLNMKDMAKFMQDKMEAAAEMAVKKTMGKSAGSDKKSDKGGGGEGGPKAGGGESDPKDEGGEERGPKAENS